MLLLAEEFISFMFQFFTFRGIKYMFFNLTKTNKKGIQIVCVFIHLLVSLIVLIQS